MMETQPLFPTTLYSSRVDDSAWRDALLADLAVWRQEVPETGRRSSHGEAWQSPREAFRRPAFAPLLKEAIAKATEVFRAEGYFGKSTARMDEMWANINSAGAYHVVHDHGAAHWSGVYYLAVPDGSPGIVFMDPRGGIGANRPRLKVDSGRDRHHQAVSSGQLLLFPAWLMHYVVPHQGTEPRISISFNIRQVVGETVELLPRRKTETPHFFCVPGVLSLAECDLILAHGRDADWSAGSINKGKVRPETRAGDTTFINSRDPGSEWHWLYQRLMTHAGRANEEHFGLDISGGIQPQQVGRYGPGQFYKPHRDLGKGNKRRSLSCAVTLQMADQGGGTSFTEAPKQPGPQSPGDAIFFRADELHAADKVEKGERFSLVAWFQGQE